MDCRDYALELDDLMDARLPAGRADELRAHAAVCAACRNRLEGERALRQALRDLPAPVAAPGFASRILAPVQRTRRSMQPRFAARVGFALAASLALAVGLRAWLVGSDTSVTTAQAPAYQVELAASEMKPVRLVFRSPRALEDVTVELQLPDGVELAGHPGRQQLSWQTDLQAGANQLELPVVIQRGEGGILTANLSLGQDHRQFEVLVKARRPAVLFLERPAAAPAAAGRSDFPTEEVAYHA